MSTTLLRPPAAPELVTVRAVEPRPIPERTPPPAQPRRRFTAWDTVGILGLAWVMLVVNQIGVTIMATPLGQSPVIDTITIAVMVTAVASFAVLMVWERPPRGAVPVLLTDVWTDPPGAWVSFVLGALLAIPVLGLFYPILFNDSDSARLVASMLYVQRGNLHYFADTQESFLPHLLLTPVMAIGGLAALKAVAIGSLMVLAGVVAYVTHRVTQTMSGAAAAAVGLLCLEPFLDRGVRLPMYTIMLALGYLGGWLGYRAVIEPSSRWRYALPAGLCLGLSQEAHGVGQLFLAVPVLLMVFAPQLRDGAHALARMMAAMSLVVVPRFAVNLSEGGLAHLPVSRTDYWVTNGYLFQIQTDFWHYTGVNDSVGAFLQKLPDRFVNGLGSQAWLILIGAAVGWLFCARGRARWFVLAAVAFFFLAVTVKRIPPFARYYSPVWPGLVILLGVAMAKLCRRRQSRWLTTGLRLGAGCLSIVLVVSAAFTYRETVERNDSLRRQTELQPFRELATAIDDGRGVIGARSHVALLSVADDIPTWGDQFLAEQEYVTYLTWPSDEAVMAMMDRHEIGWALVHSWTDLEVRYNDTWLLPHYGKTARHVVALQWSVNFCRYLETGGYVLYRRGPCPDSYPG